MLEHNQQAGAEEDNLPRDNRKLHSYARGESIPLYSNSVWQVEQGFVKLSLLELDGREMVLGIAGPSMPFGLYLTNLGAYQATALSNVHLLWFSDTEITASPSLALALLSQLRRRLQQTEALFAITGHVRAEERLWHLLLFLKKELGQPTAEGTRLSVYLTHEDLANLIRTTRVTVTRLLGKLKQQGVISTSKRSLILQECEFDFWNGSACRTRRTKAPVSSKTL